METTYDIEAVEGKITLSFHPQCVSPCECAAVSVPHWHDSTYSYSMCSSCRTYFLGIEEAEKVVMNEDYWIRFVEQCNCGDVIRHNEGGNPHEIIWVPIGEEYFQEEGI